MDRAEVRRVTLRALTVAGVLLATTLVGCGSDSNKVAGTKYWTGSLNGAGFTNDVAVVQGTVSTTTPTASKVYVTTSDGRFSKALLTGVTAGTNSITGKLAASKAAGDSWTATVGYGTTGAVTSLKLTNPAGDGSAEAATSTTNPFARSYAGTYTGDYTGVWTFKVSAAGAISTVLVDGEGSGSGTISDVGVATVTAAAGSGSVTGARYTFKGTGKLNADGSVTWSGTWTASGTDGASAGTWTGASTS